MFPSYFSFLSIISIYGNQISLIGGPQRLEFLGDAVLDYLMTSYFFTVFPKLKPGQLTDLRSLSVNNEALANVAVSFSLKRFLFCESIYLHEVIEDYTNFLASSPLASGQSEGPRCPKVRSDLPFTCHSKTMIRFTRIDIILLTF